MTLEPNVFSGPEAGMEGSHGTCWDSLVFHIVLSSSLTNPIVSRKWVAVKVAWVVTSAAAIGLN